MGLKIIFLLLVVLGVVGWEVDGYLASVGFAVGVLGVQWILLDQAGRRLKERESKKGNVA